MHSNPVETTISDEAIEWFAKLHSGQATPDDYGCFERWRKLSPVHAKAYADVEKFWTLLDKPAQRVFAQERVYGKTHGSLAVSSFINRSVRRAFVGASLAAAAIAMLFWLPDTLRFCFSDYHTAWGERKEFSLEEGSHISLNTHSALSVEFSPEQRMIKLLEGEAYFQVTHNPARPFIVVTAHGTVRVTGTTFNVYETDERMTVTLSEGRVRVYGEGANDQAVELTAGLQATSDSGGIGPVLRVDTEQASAWRNGLLIFNMQPLATVVDELNRYLPGKLMIADPRIRERIVSGAFDLTNPDDIPGAIEKTLGLDSLNLSTALTLLYQPSL